MTLWRFRSRRGLVSVVLVLAGGLFGALAIEALTLFGAPQASVFDLGAWGKKRILIVWMALLVLFCAGRYFGLFDAVFAWVKKMVSHQGRALRRLLFLCGGFFTTGAAGFAVFALMSLFGFFSLSIAESLFCFALSGCVFLIIATRKTLARYPENTFVPVGLVLGVLIALLTPVQSSVAFDDHIHYDRSVALSYLSSPEYTAADMELLSPPYIGSTEEGYWGFSQTEYFELLSDLNESGGVVSEATNGFSSAMGSSTLQYSFLGYIPGAFGLWLGRLLHLPFVAVFVLGKIMSVLFYFMLVYFAVRRLKAQKVLFLVFALLPAQLYIASNYSYDIWITGWIIFGFARYLSWLQNPQEQLTVKEVLVVLLAFAVGLGPKPIYFPIFFFLLFLPCSKFPSRKFARRYRVVVAGSALLVLSTFFLPFLVQGPGVGDVRGGADVNAAAQVRFIIEDPLRYAGILSAFLADYLSLHSSSSYTSLFAYLGTSSLGALPLVFLMLVAVTDSNKNNYSYALWRYRGAALVFLLGVSALVATALYISFTSVGSQTVAGCQGRYLLPVLLPFLALFFNSRVNNENSRFGYNLVALSVSTAFVVVCVMQLNLAVYTG